MEVELKVKNQENYFFVVVGIVGMMFLLVLLFYSCFVVKCWVVKDLEVKNLLIEEECQCFDELLFNILLVLIVEELKVKGKVQVKQYEEVMVFFFDFKNFIFIVEQLILEELVEELDKCFKGFDFILSQYEDFEKIKIIGDVYMCVGGLSECKGLFNNMIKVVLEMQVFLEE